MKLKYTGTAPVDIPMLGVTVNPGDTIEVDDDQGAEMIAQGVFKAVQSTKRKK